MPQQYAASDTRTGLNVQVTGDFPNDPDDRVRIARTTNLFTRLMATILSTTNATERRERFRSIETQLEVADALIRGDVDEVQRLIRDTLRQMGVTDDQLAEVERQLRQQLEAMGAGGIEGFEGLFNIGETRTEEPAADDPPLAQPREDWLPDEPLDEPAAEQPGDELPRTPADDETADDETADDEPADGDSPAEPGDAAADDATADDDEQPDNRA